MKQVDYIRYYIDTDSSLIMLIRDSILSTNKEAFSNVISCDGQYLRISDYPRLFTLIGHAHCPPTLSVPLPWAWLRALFGKPTHAKVLNPKFRPDHFKLPNLNASFPKELGYEVQ